MQTREKNLAIVFAAVLGLMVVWTVLKPWYLGPINEQTSQLAAVQSELEDLENEQMRVLNATRRLADWKSQSLPPDPKPVGRGRPDALNGQRLYKDWLTDLARHCGFQNPEVVPNLTRAIQDVYVTAQVRVKGRATYHQLCQFLALFEQTELLHRIESCIVQSPNFRGDPLLEINLVAEGVALQNAPRRDALFPRTALAAPVQASDTQLTVKDPEGFPESGRFSIRLGEERLLVVNVKGNEWQVNRGKDGTEAADHGEGVAVDLGLFNPLGPGDSESEPHPRLAALAEENPFTIPPPKTDHNPYLDVPREQLVYLGSRLEFAARAEDFNPGYGSPKFEIVGDVPEGLQIEPSSDPYRRLISWQPEEKSLIDTYDVAIRVNREDLEEPLTRSVRIVVRDRNDPPSVEEVGRQVVYSGQPLKFTIQASDENPDQRLTFSLGDASPPEAYIDPDTGEFSWTPPGAVNEQSLDLEIVVTDDGEPPEQARTVVPVEIQADVAQFTRFVGSLANPGGREAWLFDRWNKRDVVIKEGEMLEVADISARLKEVHSDRLVFERDAETWVLELGQDVREMAPRESAATAQTEE